MDHCIQCEQATTNHCQGCGQTYCTDHYTEHRKKLQEDYDEIIYRYDLVNREWVSILFELSSDATLELMKPIYEFSLKSDKIEKTVKMIKPQLQKLIDNQDDFAKQSIEITESEYLENDIERLKDEIKELELKLEEMNSNHQSPIDTPSVENHHESIRLPSFSWKHRCPARLFVGTLKNCVPHREGDTPTLSHLLVKPASPSILDLQDNEFVLVQSENGTPREDDNEDGEEIIVYIDSNDNNTSRISHRVHFSNNIVRYLRGPFKSLVHGLMHTVDVFAQGTHINETCLHAVKKGLERQKKQTTNRSILPTFADINSDWKFQGQNPDQGFSSPSLWMRNDQDRRVLIKIQEHPLCAANEWLAYGLGRFLGLPVNEVQIGIYENSLVTIHTDVASEDEKTVSFMDLPRLKRKALMTDPIMERMDIFDRIIQNVDRNQQNILITMPKTADIHDESARVKIHLIDHSNCFGMGKLNGISLIAAKFHSNHLAVVKFDPIHKSRQFELYLSKLPVGDRPLISKTLNRFVSIMDKQIDDWIGEIQDLLSSGQYNRIYGVLRRQRDIAKRYTTQWGIHPRSSSDKPEEKSFVFLLFYSTIGTEAFDLLHRHHRLVSVSQVPLPSGDPLFLTPYLEAGQIDLARNLSQVHLQPAYSYPSYSGYLAVNKTCNSNLFFWFFPAQNDRVDSPLLVWLQGGPGASSLFGLFSEHGPVQVDEAGQLHPRNITWNSKYHLLYIDQPVGTGFSFTADDQCYVHTEDEVARDLYAMLTQFFQIYYEYASCDFYATGESYAGKYVPAIVYKIHTENPRAKLKINLKGMAIGDGLVDPYNQWDYGPAMYQMGLIDQRELEYINLLTAMAREAIQQGQYRQAYSIFDDLFDNIYPNKTGMIDAENYLRTNFPDELFYYFPWVTASEHRQQIHVGNLTYNDGEKVQIALQDDAMQSITSKVAMIANENYKVLIYSGLLDVIISSSVTMNWVDKMEWNYADQLRLAERTIWKVNEDDREVAGYLKRANTFVLAWIRNAGHSVPYEQPRAAFDLIDRFISFSS